MINYYSLLHRLSHYWNLQLQSESMSELHYFLKSCACAWTQPISFHHMQSHVRHLPLTAASLFTSSYGFASVSTCQIFTRNLFVASFYSIAEHQPFSRNFYQASMFATSHLSPYIGLLIAFLLQTHSSPNRNLSSYTSSASSILQRPPFQIHHISSSILTTYPLLEIPVRSLPFLHAWATITFLK